MGSYCQRRRWFLAKVIAMAAVMTFLSLVTSSSYSQSPDKSDENPPSKYKPPEKVEPVDPIKEADTVRLDTELEFFGFVENDSAHRYRGNKIPDPKKEMAAAKELMAFDYVLAFASKQPLDRLAKYSQKNVGYANLYKPIHVDYLRELIHFEGRLMMVSVSKATPDLIGLEKIDKLYDCWIVPKNQSEPLCLVVTELPPGIEPGEDIKRMVSFDAYFFKLWRYESRQKNNNDSEVWRRAPLFLGRGFNDLGVIETKSPQQSSGMLLGLGLGMGGLLAIVVLMALWFKKSDKLVRDTNQRRMLDNVNIDKI
jgi:hypothetical protein